MLSIYLVSLGGIFPIGGVIQGWIGDRIGLGHTTAIACGVMLLVLAYLQSGAPGDVRAATRARTQTSR